MARVGVKVSIGTDLGNRVRGGTAGSSFGGAPSTLPSTATVAADVATLVADGATPTQGHVNTLNTDWGTLLTALNAMSVETGDLYVSWDTTKITTITQLKAAFDLALQQALGSSTLTA